MNLNMLEMVWHPVFWCLFNEMRVNYTARNWMSADVDENTKRKQTKKEGRMKRNLKPKPMMVFFCFVTFVNLSKWG